MLRQLLFLFMALSLTASSFSQLTRLKQITSDGATEGDTVVVADDGTLTTESVDFVASGRNIIRVAPTNPTQAEPTNTG